MTPSHDYASGNRHAIRVVKQSRIVARKWIMTKKSIHLSNDYNGFLEAIFGSWDLDLVPAILHIFKSEKLRLRNVGKQRVWGSIFSQKCQKGSPRPFVLPRGSHRDFRKRDSYLVSRNITDFQFPKTWEFSLRFEWDRDFFGQNPRGPYHLFDFSAPGRPGAGQSLLPPIP